LDRKSKTTGYAGGFFIVFIFIGKGFFNY